MLTQTENVHLAALIFIFVFGEFGWK